jgi:hypothetical protein
MFWGVESCEGFSKSCLIIMINIRTCKVSYWCQFLRFTISAHKIAKQLGEARALAPVRAPPKVAVVRESHKLFLSLTGEFA